MEKKRKEKEERENLKKKKKELENLLEISKRYRSFAILDLRKNKNNLQQKIRREIKKINGVVKFVRKAIINKFFSELGLKKSVDFPTAIVLANEEPYNLFNILMENNIDVAAKPFDIAPFDIIAKAGETKLQPGPALSKLKAAGLNVKVEKGKIVIAKDSVIVKANEIISEEKAQIMQMLGIKPFKAEPNVVFAYDISNKLLYEKDVLSITKEKIINDIKEIMKSVKNMAINASIPSLLSINELLIKSFREAKNVSINSSFYSDAFINDLLIKSIKEAYVLNKRMAAS